MDCFVAFAPRNDDRHTRPHSPGANAPELCKQFVAPKKTEGAGKAGCSMHPQPRTQTKKRASVVATGSPKHSDLPCAMVYGLFRLSPVTGLFCHCRFAGIASRETWRQRRGVRTTRLRRPPKATFVLRRQSVHRISRPTSV